MKKFFLIPCLLLAFSLATHAQFIVTIRPDPPKIVVVKPASPGPRFIWIDGHWIWDKMSHQYIWEKGYWIKARKSHIWIDGRWVEATGGWQWIPGHWKRR